MGVWSQGFQVGGCEQKQEGRLQRGVSCSSGDAVGGAISGLCGGGGSHSVLVKEHMGGEEVGVMGVTTLLGRTEKAGTHLRSFSDSLLLSPSPDPPNQTLSGLVCRHPSLGRAPPCDSRAREG